MNNYLRGITLSCLALFAGSSVLQAQAVTPPPAIVTTGLLQLSLDGTFHSTLVNSGITTLYQNYQVLSNGQVTYTATNGTLDLPTGAGEIQTTGGLQFVTSGSTKSLSLRNFVFDSTGKTQNVTALVIQNGKELGRKVVFNSSQGSTFDPLPLTYGGNQSDVVYFTLSVVASNLLTSTFGITPIPPTTVVCAFLESVTIYQDPTLSL